jgi:hypothetical protein
MWKLHPRYGVWCGGINDEQPTLLECRLDKATMEEYLFVRATGERLQPINPRHVFNTDEKPCVLSRIHGETIVFGDVSSPTMVPQQKRESNCTLVITTRGDGKVVGLSVIFPAGVKRINSAVWAIFERYPDLEINIFHTPTGFSLSFFL